MHCRNSLKKPLLAIRKCLKNLKILYKHVRLEILWWQILLLLGKEDFVWYFVFLQVQQIWMSWVKGKFIGDIIGRISVFSVEKCCWCICVYIHHLSVSVWSVCLLHPSFHFLCCVCVYIYTCSMICSVEWHGYLCDMLSVPRIIPITQFLLSTV